MVLSLYDFSFPIREGLRGILVILALVRPKHNNLLETRRTKCCERVISYHESQNVSSWNLMFLVLIIIPWPTCDHIVMVSFISSQNVGWSWISNMPQMPLDQIRKTFFWWVCMQFRWHNPVYLRCSLGKQPINENPEVGRLWISNMPRMRLDQINFINLVSSYFVHKIQRSSQLVWASQCRVVSAGMILECTVGPHPCLNSSGWIPCYDFKYNYYSLLLVMSDEKVICDYSYRPKGMCWRATAPLGAYRVD